MVLLLLQLPLPERSITQAGDSHTPGFLRACELYFSSGFLMASFSSFSSFPSTVQPQVPLFNPPPPLLSSNTQNLLFTFFLSRYKRSLAPRELIVLTQRRRSHLTCSFPLCSYHLGFQSQLRSRGSFILSLLQAFLYDFFHSVLPALKPLSHQSISFVLYLQFSIFVPPFQSDWIRFSSEVMIATSHLQNACKSAFTSTCLCM